MKQNGHIRIFNNNNNDNNSYNHNNNNNNSRKSSNNNNKSNDNDNNNNNSNIVSAGNYCIYCTGNIAGSDNSSRNPWVVWYWWQLILSQIRWIGKFVCLIWLTSLDRSLNLCLLFRLYVDECKRDIASTISVTVPLKIMFTITDTESAKYTVWDTLHILVLNSKQLSEFPSGFSFGKLSQFESSSVWICLHISKHTYLICR